MWCVHSYPNHFLCFYRPTMSSPHNWHRVHISSIWLQSRCKFSSTLAISQHWVVCQAHWSWQGCSPVNQILLYFSGSTGRTLSLSRLYIKVVTLIINLRLSLGITLTAVKLGVPLIAESIGRHHRLVKRTSCRWWDSIYVMDDAGATHHSRLWMVSIQCGLHLERSVATAECFQGVIF